MSKVFIEESTLTAIGNAIREKTSKSDLIPPLNMPTEIKAIQTGGLVEAIDITANGTYTAPEGIDGYNPITVDVPQDGAPPEEAFIITGNCSFRFAYSGWDWFLKLYKDKITITNVTNAQSMFQSSGIELVPSIDFNQKSYCTFANVFNGCNKVKEIGTLKNVYPSDMSYFFSHCHNLRELPQFENLNLNRIYTYANTNMTNMFASCYSLRSISEDFLKQFYQPLLTGYYYSVLNGEFNQCYSLDEIRGLNPQTGTITSNMLGSTFSNCYRLKDIIFATQDDGTPYVVKWKSQTMDLSVNVGYTGTIANSNNILNYNNGITADKKVTDDATYQALKDDADWFTQDIAYSRYNHDSAVNTINSLPDTSAYLATAGGTNTIKFKGAAGEKTDGGAINTLTAEEIAVASAKGWTVSLV